MSSVFGNLGNTNNNASDSSPFGSVGQSKPPGFSLFQNAQASEQTSQAGGSSSEQAAAPAQSKSSLFGRIGPLNNPPATASQTAATTSGSGGFLNQPTTSGATVGGGFLNQNTSGTLGGGGLLGTTSTSQSQAAPSGGLFASTQAPQNSSAPAASGSTFGASILNNMGGQGLAQSNGQEAQAQNVDDKAPRAALFQDLLERGKKRRDPNDMSMRPDQLPSLQLNLGDFSSKIRGLGSNKPDFKASRAGDSRAQYLLAASGVPQGATRRDLQAFETQPRPTVRAPAPAFDPDNDAFVAKLDQKTTLEMMEESSRQSAQDFNRFIEDMGYARRTDQIRRAYDYLGIPKPDDLGEANDDEAGLGNGQGAFGRTNRSLGPNGSFQRSSMRATGISKSVLGGTIGRGSVRQQSFTDVAEQAPSGGIQSALENSFTRGKQDRYAACVRELNIARLRELVCPIVERFTLVEIEGGSDTPRNVIHAYQALKEIVREDSKVDRPSDPGAVKERQYMKDYLDETENSQRPLALRKQILYGSRKFLEENFFKTVEDEVAKNPQDGNPGGRPAKIDQVRAYVRILVAKKKLAAANYELQKVNDDYCWVLIFYLLRAGLVKEAMQYVSENERAMKSMDSNFPLFIKSFSSDPERRVPQNLQRKMDSEYYQRSKNAPEGSIDPYRMACYKIIGRCDLDRKSFIDIDIEYEDLIWLYFCLARESSKVEEVSEQVFDLKDVQNMIREIGQQHFMDPSAAQAGQSYSIYFLLQMLSGMFEEAVSYLYSHNYVAAVHFAIGLDFYGLLRVSDFSVSESKLLTYTTRQKPQISFARLLGEYTSDFRIARPEAATDYITLICLNADLPGELGQSQVWVCHEALKELVLQTREFALLLGDIRADGKRIKGAIEQRLPLMSLDDRDGFLRVLTTQAASIADDNGRTTDAVLLYHLASEYDNVIATINRALSDALSLDLGQEQLRLQPLKPRDAAASASTEATDAPQEDAQALADGSTLSLTSVDDPATLARNMLNLYDSNAKLYISKIRPQNRDAIRILLRMSEIKTRVLAGRWAESFDLIQGLEILPLTANGNVNVIRGAAQGLNNLQPVVARNIGSLLVWTVECCSQQRKILRESSWQIGGGTGGAGGANNINENGREMLKGLASATRDVMVFAGMVRYKLPGDVYEMLAMAGQDVDGL
ncbi:MAG: hypothetical protein M1831_007236 [Alyxoria varia]|nr:MAG: hypothetical protein M1831_007236 [Alyxoria varia]